MICNSCRDAGERHIASRVYDECHCYEYHNQCTDNDPKTGKQNTLYRSCGCQHRCGSIVKESAIN